MKEHGPAVRERCPARPRRRLRCRLGGTCFIACLLLLNLLKIHPNLGFMNYSGDLTSALLCAGIAKALQQAVMLFYKEEYKPDEWLNLIWGFQKGSLTPTA